MKNPNEALNPFEALNTKLDFIVAQIAAIKMQVITHDPDRKIPFKEFCQEHSISRPTGYSWAAKKLIEMQKIGGRQYVLASSIQVKKYQRSLAFDSV